MSVYIIGDIVLSPTSGGDEEVIKIRSRDVDKVSVLPHPLDHQVLPMDRDACAVCIHLKGKLEPVTIYCETVKQAQHILGELTQFTRP